MTYAFTPTPTVGLPITGSADLFPLRRVYCAGRNYAAHAREMGFDRDREPPFFFCKPNDNTSVVPVATGTIATIAYPPLTSNHHIEAEPVVCIGTGGANIAIDDATKHIFGYAVGLDMTRRDLQIRMREAGRPWEIGKAFDYSAPVGPVKRIADIGEISTGAIDLSVDGATKQKSDITHLIWSVNEVIANLSTLFTLEPGDLIFSGTPEGVSAVRRGQTMHVSVEELDNITVRVN